MEDQTFTGNTLTLLAFRELQYFFKTGTKGHDPSPDMLEGLYNLQETLSRMVTGDLKPKVYVSSLQPGVGKTSAIKAWLKVYLARRQQYSDRGVILCFDRLEEIAKFLKGNPIAKSDFGVYVNNTTPEGRKLNALGVGFESVSVAPVLFTTKQQIIRKAMKGESFESIDLFHYTGKPRSVRIWDESMIIGRPITVTVSQITELYRTIDESDLILGQMIWDLAVQLKQSKDKDLIDFPDFGGEELIHGFKWEGDTTKKTAEALSLLSGRVVTVRTDGAGRVVLDCMKSIPADFLPFLVTDASAVIRETYNLFNHYHGKVEQLQPVKPCKKYDPFTVYTWERSSSRDYYNKIGITETAEEIARVILSRPGERFLIVTMKGDRNSIKKKWVKAIQPLLHESEWSRIDFLTWGTHTANNDYADVPNIILTSQLHYKPAQYEAIGRAAADLPSSVGSLTDKQLQAFRRGEIAHHLLQCICRGAVRNANGVYCHEARCWIIASKGVGVLEVIPEIFPGCTVEKWETLNAESELSTPKKAESNQKKAVEFIVSVLTEGRERVWGSEVRKHMEVKSKSNFKRDYMVNPDFLSLCTDNSILIDREGDKPYFILHPFQ